MNKKPFGTTGEMLSEMCLGTMMFGDRCDQSESDRILAMAMENGVNFVDTAAMYCKGVTEEILGHILKGRREKLFIGTKVNHHDPQVIRTSIDESLARMKLAYVDLYMLHWPKQGMNPTEMMGALNDVVQQGKARFVGCCNFPAWLFAHFNAIAQQNDWPKLVCNQIPCELPTAQAVGLQGRTASC
jgi:1-deoxyxylulose-5-phosphate synthase